MDLEPRVPPWCRLCECRARGVCAPFIDAAPGPRRLSTNAAGYARGGARLLRGSSSRRDSYPGSGTETEEERKETGTRGRVVLRRGANGSEKVCFSTTRLRESYICSRSSRGTFVVPRLLIHTRESVHNTYALVCACVYYIYAHTRARTRDPRETTV